MAFSFKGLNKSMWKSHKQTKDLLTMAEIRQGGAAAVDSPRSGKQRTSNIADEKTQRNDSYNLMQKIGFFLGPLLFFIILFALPLSDLSFEGKAVLAVTA